MPIGHDDVKRKGPGKAGGRDSRFPALFRVEIPLNVAPDSDWIDCFKNPTSYNYNEANPKRASIWKNILEYAFSEENLKGKIEQVDRYIDQANECYRRKMAEKEAEMKRQEAEANKEEEKLATINKVLEEI